MFFVDYILIYRVPTDDRYQADRIIFTIRVTLIWSKSKYQSFFSTHHVFILYIIIYSGKEVINVGLLDYCLEIIGFLLQHIN